VPASAPTADEREAFYTAAVLGLRALDAQEQAARRFGPDADARWSQFAGALGAGDRLDILLRDAAGKWGAAFSPSNCFGFFGLADDEPFGPDWASLQDPAAKGLLTETGGEGATIARVAAILGVVVTPVSVPSLTKATKVVIAGGAALVAAANAFAKNRELSWPNQVVAIANRGAFRQLAGLTAVLLGARDPTLIVRPSADAANAMRAAGFAHLDAAIVSSDAEPEAAELARGLGGR
jgi:hypothetical protein